MNRRQFAGMLGLGAAGVMLPGLPQSDSTLKVQRALDYTPDGRFMASFTGYDNRITYNAPLADFTPAIPAGVKLLWGTAQIRATDLPPGTPAKISFLTGQWGQTSWQWSVWANDATDYWRGSIICQVFGDVPVINWRAEVIHPDCNLVDVLLTFTAIGTGR